MENKDLEKLGLSAGTTMLKASRSTGRNAATTKASVLQCWKKTTDLLNRSIKQENALDQPDSKVRD